MAIQALKPESLAERMVAELNENPEARRLLLRALLTDDFLMLPAKVDRLMDLPAKVDMLMELPGRVERLESDVSDLKAGQAELKSGQAELKSSQAELKSSQAELGAKQDELAAKQDELGARQDKLAAKQDELGAKQDELAAKQDELGAKQDELGANQTRMEGEIADLKAGQADLKAGQADLKAVQNRMQGHLGNLAGRDYERRRVASIVHTVRRTLGIDNARVLKGNGADAGELNNKVADAERRGIITLEQSDSLFLADAIMSGARQSDLNPIHAVAEISVTIGEKDVERAAERAKILATVMGEPAMGIVIGDSISAPDRRRAERNEVAVALIRQQWG